MAPEAGDVVQQPAGLVLLGVEPGQGAQPQPVATGFSHVGPDTQPVAVRRADQVDLVGIETEVVEFPHPLGDLVALLLGTDDHVFGQGVPELVVPLGDLQGQLDRLDVGGQETGGGQVEQLAPASRVLGQHEPGLHVAPGGGGGVGGEKE